MGTLWKDHAFANLVTLAPAAKVKVINKVAFEYKGFLNACYRRIRGKRANH